MNFSGVPVLVTGSGGFIASSLMPELSRNGAKVFGMSQHKVQQGEGTIVDNYIADMRDFNQVREVLAEVRPQYIFHLAGSKERGASFEEFQRSIENNVLGTLNLARASLEQGGVRHFVSLGSCEEYGGRAEEWTEASRENPVSAYSCSKVAVSHMLQTLYQTHGFAVTILRPSLVYGPGQGIEMFVPAMINSLLAQKNFAMSEGEQERDLLYVDDLVQAILLTVACPRSVGEVINISCGEPVKIKDLAMIISNIVGEYTTALVQVGKLDYRKKEVMNCRISSQKAALLLGWKSTTSLSQGLKRTVAFYKGRLKEGLLVL